MDVLRTTEAPPPVGVAAFDRRVLAVGGVVFAVLMALSTRYGFQRDELYFLDCARHLQAGYVDQPMLAPLLARVSLELFGEWLPGLRLWPALAAGATVVIGGLTAREFGGTRRVQLFAAVATATMPALWAAAHVANTTPYAVLALAALAFVVARVGRTGDPRWWLLAGLVAGLGLANNHQAAFFAFAVVAGALLSGGRRLLFNGWFAGGVAIAAAFAGPEIWWQAQHGWATIEMTRKLNQENGGLPNAPVWVVGQLLMASLALVWVWVAGLRHLWRTGRPLWRALVWAYGLLFVLYAVTTGVKVYYLMGAYVYLLAAGAVAVDGWLYARRRRIRILTVATALGTAVFAALLLPVLPPTGIGPRHAMDATLTDTIGWPELVDTVGTVWTSLPPPQRAAAVIFTENYSEAAAVNELGRGRGLPTAVSGHNSQWWWGPGNPGATTVIAVAPGTASGYTGYLGRFFTDVREVATVTNRYGVRNIESGGHVYLCTGLREPWSQLWPRLRHYD
ncbi:glycosyltransferase family 39 protein [Dactylosporangium sp. NPDC049140]|uniref:ArnT family glycosyltransferase n=1 Tax=Dactylosporangium sp. NPDC049140 TaxID=3155647 RepID=UPI0033F21BE2